MRSKVWSGLVGLEILAFTFVQGSMITLGLVVAPALFKTIASRDLAGRTFGQILGVWLWPGLVCLAILALSAAFTLWKLKPVGWLLWGRLVSVVLMLGLVIAFGVVLARLNSIQDGLTAPIETYPSDVNPRLEYDQLHKLSTNLLSGALGLGLVWFGLSLAVLVGQFKKSTAGSALQEPVGRGRVAAAVGSGELK